MKFILLLIVTISLPSALAQTTYYLREGKECFVKEFKDGVFTDAAREDFKGRELLAKPHSKNEKYIVIREEGSVYVVRKKCMSPVEKEPDFEMDEPEEVPPPPPKKKRKKSQRSERNEVTNWMIDIEGGGTFFSGQEQILPDYSAIDGDYDGSTVALNEEAKKTKYTGGSLFALTIGRRVTESGFLAFKVKRYSGKKEESVDGTIDGSPQTIIFNYKDTFTSALFGMKFVFLQTSSLRPTLGLFLGGNLIETETLFKASSYGGSAELNLGLEYFFTESFAIGFNSGAEILGQREFELKENEEKLKYKTKHDYTNYFGTLGVKFYL